MRQDNFPTRRNFLKTSGLAALSLLFQNVRAQSTFSVQGLPEDVSEEEILDILEYSLPFAGIQTFMKLPYSRQPKDILAADMIVMGVPFDSGTTNRSGSRMGPRAVREQSFYVAAFEPLYPMLQLTEEVATELFGLGKSLLTLGGDHTLPIRLVRGAAKKYGPLALVHLDAHQDSYNADEFGEPKAYNHGVFATELVKEGHIDPAKSSQVYIRTIQPDSPKGGYDIVYANDAIQMGPEALAERVKARVGNMPGGFVDYPVTNRAVARILDDDQYGLSSTFGTSLGEVTNATFAGNLFAIVTASGSPSYPSSWRATSWNSRHSQPACPSS